MPFDLAIIDLDNTLYAADNGVFADMDQRMMHFIARELAVSDAEANKLRIDYWHRYGTTLKGLMQHHHVEPEAFLHEVHDLDVHRMLQADSRLNQTLHDLPGKKVIHTNGTREHAMRILSVLGVSEHFHAVYDIRFRDYQPKPCANTLQLLMHEECISPQRCVVLDDMEANLDAARALGALTVWVHPSAHDAPSDVWDFHVPAVYALPEQLQARRI